MKITSSQNSVTIEKDNYKNTYPKNTLWYQKTDNGISILQFNRCIVTSPLNQTFVNGEQLTSDNIDSLLSVLFKAGSGGGVSLPIQIADVDGLEDKITSLDKFDNELFERLYSESITANSIGLAKSGNGDESIPVGDSYISNLRVSDIAPSITVKEIGLYVPDYNYNYKIYKATNFINGQQTTIELIKSVTLNKGLQTIYDLNIELTANDTILFQTDRTSSLLLLAESEVEDSSLLGYTYYYAPDNTHTDYFPTRSLSIAYRYELKQEGDIPRLIKAITELQASLKRIIT